MSAASIAGGLSGYGIGRFLGRLPFIGRLTAAYALIRFGGVLMRRLLTGC